MKYHQQGDVLLFREQIPETAKQATKDPVLQHGESTGHAHRLTDEDFELFEQPETKTRYLRLLKPSGLRHEEHKEIILPPGDYRIDIVREVGGEEDEEYIRTVTD